MAGLYAQPNKGKHTLTEGQIERRVEYKTDTLDKAFMRGDMKQAEYERAVRALDKWAEEQYQKLKPI